MWPLPCPFGEVSLKKAWTCTGHFKYQILKFLVKLYERYNMWSKILLTGVVQDHWRLLKVTYNFLLAIYSTSVPILYCKTFVEYHIFFPNQPVFVATNRGDPTGIFTKCFSVPVSYHAALVIVVWAVESFITQYRRGCQSGGWMPGIAVSTTDRLMEEDKKQHAKPCEIHCQQCTQWPQYSTQQAQPPAQPPAQIVSNYSSACSLQHTDTLHGQFLSTSIFTFHWSQSLLQRWLAISSFLVHSLTQGLMAGQLVHTTWLTINISLTLVGFCTVEKWQQGCQHIKWNNRAINAWCVCLSITMHSLTQSTNS